MGSELVGITLTSKVMHVAQNEYEDACQPLRALAVARRHWRGRRDSTLRLVRWQTLTFAPLVCLRLECACVNNGRGIQSFRQHKNFRRVTSLRLNVNMSACCSHYQVEFCSSLTYSSAIDYHCIIIHIAAAPTCADVPCARTQRSIIDL